MTTHRNSIAARLTSGLVAAWFGLAACEPQGDRATVDTAVAGAAHGVHDEADREFLALMIGHHTGMLAIAEGAMASMPV